MSESSASIARQVEDWGVLIAEIKTAEQCDDAVEELEKVANQPLIYAPVRMKLWKHAQAKGITYDKQAKKFRDPQPAGTAA
jgi:hypothetical protein